ncbi:MAG: hypothetical protein AAFQ50_06650, partial [Pseudomonadota bacterium]
PALESYVGSSIQVVADLPDRVPAFLKGCADRGVEWKWFGADQAQGFTSAHHHWGYVAAQALPKTDRVLAGLLDMRVPLTFDLDDCAAIAAIVRDEAAKHLATDARVAPV